jgi:hypothetical protein
MLQRDDAEHPVPEEWRATFQQIADAFVAGDFALIKTAIDRVSPLDQATAGSIANNVTAYGDELAPLNSATWEWARYRWMNGHWEFIVDLTTTRDPVSDLALHSKLADSDHSALEIRSVHVP